MLTRGHSPMTPSQSLSRSHTDVSRRHRLRSQNKYCVIDVDSTEEENHATEITQNAQPKPHKNAQPKSHKMHNRSPTKMHNRSHTKCITEVTQKCTTEVIQNAQLKSYKMHN